MFSLRDSSSAYSSSTDEDSFGWWIGVESHAQLPESSSTKDEPPSVSSESAISCTGSDDVPSVSASGKYALARQNLIVPTKQEEDNEFIELRSLFNDDVEEISQDSDNDRAVCYTPERLVRIEEFRILTPSPRFYPTIADLSTTRRKKSDDDNCKIDEKHLVSFLRSPRRSSNKLRSCCRCRIRYGNGEVLLHSERCSPVYDKTDDQMRLSVPVDPLLLRNYSEYSLPYREKGSQCEEEFKDTDNTSGISSDDDGQITVTHNDDWSYGTEEEVYDDENNEEDLMTERLPRRLSDELAHVSFEYALTAREKQKGDTLNINPAVTILSKLDSDPHRAEVLLLQDEKDRYKNSVHHDCLSRLALAIEPDDRIPTVTNVETKSHTTNVTPIEAELERLRLKVERLQDSSKDFFEEITVLRRDFKKDEWKVDHLSEDINKLRNEVFELRYLDDLLKLLKGELERISNRNWPFIIGHEKYGTDEINLVV